MAERIKIVFKLTRDEEGYPPADYESLWAIKQGRHYVIDNIPFFVRKIAVGDVVRCKRVDGELRYAGTVEASGHSTVRVVFFEEDRKDTVKKKLAALGCSNEQSHLPNLIAIDIPPNAGFDRIRACLQAGEDKEWWSFEEPALRH